MMHSLKVLPFLFCVVCSAPKLRIYPKQQLPPQLLTLPGNATSIRTDITDAFSCQGREYGYYADMDNDCQIFHVCLPVRYADGKNQTFRWSFICPEDTVFNQEIFTCTNSDESIACTDSSKYYRLNSNFGDITKIDETTPLPIEDSEFVPEVSQNLEKERKPTITYESRRKVLEGRI